MFYPSFQLLYPTDTYQVKVPYHITSPVLICLFIRAFTKNLLYIKVWLRYSNYT
nr:MAG TPA: hypothetical protein [Herelleviridae sp.]